MRAEAGDRAGWGSSEGYVDGVGGRVGVGGGAGVGIGLRIWIGVRLGLGLGLGIRDQDRNLTRTQGVSACEEHVCVGWLTWAGNVLERAESACADFL